MYELNTKEEFISAIRLHMLYCLFYGLSVFAGLWQHGQPMYTCVLLCLLIPVAMLPFFNIFRNELTRSIMQILFPLIAGIWLVYRMMNHIPSDKFLMESLALAGFAFSFTLCKKDRGYFLLISSILLIYGAVYPRIIYIHLTPVIMMVILVIFYLSRTNALCQAAEIPESKAVSRFSWLYLIPHTLLLLAITIFIYMQLPVEDSTSSGYLTSNIDNNNDNYSPPMLQDWFKSKQIRRDSSGRIVTTEGENPDALSKKSNKQVSAAIDEASFSSNGNGAGQPGDDLLFTVKSDVKLYWLANLYDQYDGEKWKTTKKMAEQKFIFSWKIFKVYFTTMQKFEIKKWHTRTLPSAFHTTSFNFTERHSQPFDETFFNRKLPLGSEYPELPFQYITNTYIPYQKAEKVKKQNLWWEKLKKEHYLKLPENKISIRLKRKAGDITGDSLSGYDKAIALRNYLRKNFSYKQFSKRVPEGREAVDFFIFDLKEGHCEYFASAMVTLARLSGLPARVATGFSPGNYNIMTKEFEIYEYHAHAWAQVFIENMGWLTFDATPPGEIVSRTTPIGIGSLKDPFGDEWQVNPPELASNVQQKAPPMMSMTKENAQEIMAQAKKIKTSKLQQLLLQIPADGQELKDSFEQMKNKLGKEKSFIHRAFVSFKSNFKAFINTIAATAKGIANFFYGINGIIALLVLVSAYPVYLLIQKIRQAINIMIKRKQCEKMFDAAVKNLKDAPQKCIESCYFAIRNLLEISGYPNAQKMELFDYGTSLKHVDLQLSKDVLAVFHAYSQMSYSLKTAMLTDSEEALKRALNIRSILVVNPTH